MYTRCGLLHLEEACIDLKSILIPEPQEHSHTFLIIFKLGNSHNNTVNITSVKLQRIV